MQQSKPIDITPKIKEEYELLNYVAEKFSATGKLEDVRSLLYYEKSICLFDRIKTGESVLTDFSLPDSFISSMISEHQFEAKKKTFSDLSERRKLLAEMNDKVYNFDIDYSTKGNKRTLNDMIESTMNQILNSQRGMFPDKWPEFFSSIGGFISGEFIGIAGGSGDGKTTFAIDLIHSLQDKYNCNTAFISCEMTEEALCKKIMKRAHGISTPQLIFMAHKKQETFREFNYGNWHNCAFNYKARTLSEICDFITKEKPKFWAIDYVGMIQRDPRFASGDWAVHVSNTLKTLCKDTGSVGFGLYQLDKTSQRKGTDGKRTPPCLADIYGGIGGKQALDTGIVVYKIDNIHYVYFDKIREVYESTYAGKHFIVDGTPETGVIHRLTPKQDFKLSI